MARQLFWEVVGGVDKGGIVVRAGRELTSPLLPQKLATAARVQELSRVGDRLHYRLVVGDGPQEGWVSVKLKDKVLLEQRDTPAPAKVGAAAPPPSRPAADAARANASAPPAMHDARAARAKAVDADFQRRLEDLRLRFPGFEDPLPEDARYWVPQDLENFFESGGFIRPKVGTKPSASSSSRPSKAAASNGADRAAAVDPNQLPVREAERLQDQLREHFGATGFQEQLKALDLQFPKRRERGHTDVERYFEAFETLVLTVYCRVLPRYGMEGSWAGVQDMHARMASAMTHKEVKRKQEDINLLLGLPRDAILKKAQEFFVYRPDRDGGVPGYSVPLLQDEDGDAAHEFWVEDLATGDLRCRSSTLGGRRL